jgi:hypothetical protein
LDLLQEIRGFMLAVINFNPYTNIVLVVDGTARKDAVAPRLGFKMIPGFL